MGDGAPREPMTDEDMRRGFEQVNALEGEMKAANPLVFSGRLTEPNRAREAAPATPPTAPRSP
jgi:hypothetical protein